MRIIEQKMVREFAAMIRRMTHKQRCDMMRDLWNLDPFAFAEIRRAIVEVSKEDITHAQEEKT